MRQNGNIRIKGCKGFVLQLLRERMQTIETVRPSADCDDLVQPRMQSLYQAHKIFDVPVGRHRALFLKIGASATPNLLGLYRSACRMRGHVEPHLKNICNRDALLQHGGAEDGLTEGRNTHNAFSISSEAGHPRPTRALKYLPAH